MLTVYIQHALIQEWSLICKSYAYFFCSKKKLWMLKQKKRDFKNLENIFEKKISIMSRVSIYARNSFDKNSCSCQAIVVMWKKIKSVWFQIILQYVVNDCRKIREQKEKNDNYKNTIYFQILKNFFCLFHELCLTLCYIIQHRWQQIERERL